MYILIFFIVVISSVIYYLRTNLNKNLELDAKSNNEIKDLYNEFEDVKQKNSLDVINSNKLNNRIKNSFLDNKENKDNKVTINKDELKVEKINGIKKEILSNPQKAFLMSEIFNRKY